MKIGKGFSVLLVLVMLLSLLPCAAFADSTQPVVVHDGENVTVGGNVTVTNETNAVSVEARNENASLRTTLLCAPNPVSATFFDISSTALRAR